MTLDQLGLLHGTDKASNGHDYCKTYDRYLAPLRGRRVTLLELGVGGEAHADRGGQSLRMWRDYFTDPDAKILGVDVYRKDLKLPAGIQVHQGSQADRDFLAGLLEREGYPDVIVDDASHVNALTVQTFEHLFYAYLKPGGLYICEDVHTSYWRENYAGDPDPAVRRSAMAFFQDLTHQLQHDTLLPQHRTRYAGVLEYVHFYRNVVIIKKLP